MEAQRSRKKIKRKIGVACPVRKRSCVWKGSSTLRETLCHCRFPLQRLYHGSIAAERLRWPDSFRGKRKENNDCARAGCVRNSAGGAHSGRDREYDAIICLGCLLRGDTAHYDVIVNEVTRGIGQSAQETGVPHAFGVLTCDTLEQAIDRAGLKMGNKGFEAALAAVEMASEKKRSALSLPLSARKQIPQLAQRRQKIKGKTPEKSVKKRLLVFLKGHQFCQTDQ